MKSAISILALALLNAHLIVSQSLSSCQECYYGECESLSDNTFSCHCVTNVKGSQCEECLYPGDDLCLSNPCWNKGICKNLGNDFSCQCPKGVSGKDCRVVETDSQNRGNATILANVPLPDKYVRIRNKGGYTAILSVTYLLNGEQTTQIGTITSGQSYAFCKINKKSNFVFLELNLNNFFCFKTYLAQLTTTAYSVLTSE